MVKVIVKKRSNLLWLWILTLVLSLIVVPTASVGVVLFNNKVDNVNEVQSSEPTQLLNSMLGDSLENVSDTGKIVFEITQDDINSIIAFGVEHVKENYLTDENIKSLVDDSLVGFHVLINEDHYLFALEVNLFGFKTRIELTCRLGWIDSKVNLYHRELIFEILDLTVGKVSVINTFLNSIPEEIITEEKLQEYIDQTKLSLDVSLKKLTVRYKISNLINDLINFIGEENQGQFETYIDLIKDLLNEDLFEFSFNEGRKIHASLDLSIFNDNSKLCTHEKDNTALTAHLNKYRDFVEVLRNLEEPISANEVQIVFRFLSRGYNGLNDEDKATIDTLAAKITSVSIEGMTPISDVTTYEPPYGILPVQKDNYILNSLFEDIDPELLLSGKVTDIDEDKLNDIIDTTYIIGYSFFIETTITEGETTKTRLHYIVIDNLYCNIVDGHIYLTIGINFNGFEVVSTILFHVDLSANEPYAITLFAESMYVGEIKFDQSILKMVNPIIADALEGIDLITFNEETGVLTISFASFMGDINTQLNNLGLPGNFDDYATINIELYGLLNERGYISITWDLK